MNAREFSVACSAVSGVLVVQKMEWAPPASWWTIGIFFVTAIGFDMYAKWRSGKL